MQRGIPTFALMESELKEALFLRGELLESPGIRALIFLPLHEVPAPAEMLMLERMLEAMTFSQGEWRYLYHTGSPDWQLVDEEEVSILFFTSSNATHKIPELKNEGQVSWYLLPSLGQINADNAIKRAVWDLIKP
jgi:hypothetical protein